MRQVVTAIAAGILGVLVFMELALYLRQIDTSLEQWLRMPISMAGWSFYAYGTRIGLVGSYADGPWIWMGGAGAPYLAELQEWAAVRRSFEDVSGRQDRAAGE
jgi:hypothetical protein